MNIDFYILKIWNRVFEKGSINTLLVLLNKLQNEVEIPILTEILPFKMF